MDTKQNLFQRSLQGAQGRLKRVWTQLRPGPYAVRGAGLGIFAGAGLVFLAFALRSGTGPFTTSLIIVPLLFLLGLGMAWLAGQGVAWAIDRLHQIPWSLRWAVGTAVLLIVLSLGGLPPRGMLLVVAVLLISAGLVGFGLSSLIKGRWRAQTTGQRSVATAAVVLGSLALISGLVWYLWPGAPETAVIDSAKTSGDALAQVALTDPSLPGSYTVQTFTYGSGSDRLRSEYGEGVLRKTEPVDGSLLLQGSWQGFSGQLRSLLLGFDPKSLPLNGRVWYPQGEGPFPLVLMVHGNHLMTDFSDPGYAYLGTLLASRGYIFISVDENFLNGSVFDLFESMHGENDARGWLLLQHLHLWQAWNDDPGDIFYQKVDMQNIAIGGHSRGGEAAAIAAAFNRLPYYPDNANLEFDFDYNIRAVISIAPSDGQYSPAWRSLELENVNYLLLQGSHDSDVTSFFGSRQYERISFDPGSEWFKASLYVYRANHGQFNSVWGDNDRFGLAGGFLNRAALLPGAAQRKIAEVTISAFLDAALRGEPGYLPLFMDARAAGEGWLPDTIYINRFDRAGDRLLATFEEDIDLQSTTLAGGSTSGVELKTWREQRLNSRAGGAETSVVYLGWDESAAAAYTILLPVDGLDLAGSDALIFQLADAGEDPPPANGQVDAGAGGQRQPLDLSIVLEDDAGQVASLPLSQYRMVQPQLTAHLYKADVFQKEARSEAVLHGYVLPLADFAAAVPSFNPRTVRAVRFVFDRTPRGSLILDGVGFRNLSESR